MIYSRFSFPLLFYVPAMSSVTAIQHETEIADLKSMVASLTSELKSMKTTPNPKGNKMKYTKKQNESGDVHQDGCCSNQPNQQCDRPTQNNHAQHDNNYRQNNNWRDNSYRQNKNWRHVPRPQNYQQFDNYQRNYQQHGYPNQHNSYHQSAPQYNNYRYSAPHYNRHRQSTPHHNGNSQSPHNDGQDNYRRDDVRVNRDRYYDNKQQPSN